MDLYLVVLRVVHIGTAILWVGSAFVIFVFVNPSAAALGAEARPFFDYLEKRHFRQVMSIVAAVSIVSGALLYWEASNGLDLDWITSPTGSVISVGAVSAITSFVFGKTVGRLMVRRLTQIDTRMASGEETPQLASDAARLGSRLELIVRVRLGLLLFAAAAMASARYL